MLKIPSIPKDEQVLFHPEAFGPQESAAAFRQAATSTRPLFRVAVQFRKLHQLVVLKGVVVARLLPHPRRVNDQRLLRVLEGRSFSRENKCDDRKPAASLRFSDSRRRK